MKKKILLLLLVSTFIVGQVRSQDTGALASDSRDSVLYQTTFYFQLGLGEWIDKSDYPKTYSLLRWAKANPTMPIEITGWADKSGSEAFNRKLSLRRARTISNYLVRNGIAKERITFNGQGVDHQAISDNKARRADVCGVIRLATTIAPQQKPKDVVDVVLPPAKEVVVQQVVEEQHKQDNKQQEEQKPAIQPKIITSQTAPINSKLSSPNRWYAGIDGGVSFGVSTLSSFTSKGGAGWNVGVLGGYRISPLLSAEVGITFGSLKLGSSKCCFDYFLGADGMRYLEHVAGMDSYSYKDIHSSVSMQQYALRLNIDMLQIVKPDWNKRWSLNISPAIYGVNTTATLKSGKTIIIKRNSQFQFGAGAGIGVGYQINKNLGIGIRSGALWVIGKRYDGIMPTDHKDNMIWNNTVSLTWRFGKMKNE